MATERVEVARIKCDSGVNTIWQAKVVRALRRCQRIAECDWDDKDNAIVIYGRVPLPKGVQPKDDK